ncbi:Gfo/Idh/MocA family oxidoreductase [Leifsonia sp. NPDC077715]|uniref:Gfo/Idh/MocA family protein n=1 Tax=Leifsonia sp. NPDC077715 TaxID=3155539 RepID=UPI00342A9CC4
MQTIGVGVIGTGMISNQYLTNLTSFRGMEVRYLADLDSDRARAQAEKFGIANSGSSKELLGRDDIEIVINLTIPAVHAEVSESIVASQKHVWSEKPLATSGDSARALLTRAEAQGVRVGCAPDTFLGRGVQRALQLIRDGVIGEPVYANTAFMTPGPEVSHPNPEFLFAAGGGPLFDMGPYYLTALVQALGPIASVNAAASTSRAQRTIQVGPRAGTPFDVTTATHYSAQLKFRGGVTGQSVFSFDSALVRTGVIEITGTEGTLVFPDPNQFGGVLRLYRPGSFEPEEFSVDSGGLTRGIGVAEMAEAIREDRPHRASGDLACHVLDTMLAIEGSASRQSPMVVESSAAPAPLLAGGWDPRN